MGQGEASDLAHARAAREGVGADCELMIDAGLCWDTATAIRRARQFEPLNLAWLEEPLHPDNVAGYAKLSAAAPMRIAAGEEICDIKEFQTMMDVGGIDVAQVDVTRVGGLSRSKRIGWDSAERHRLCVNHYRPPNPDKKPLGDPNVQPLTPDQHCKLIQAMALPTS